jgi:hypothetical protein
MAIDLRGKRDGRGAYLCPHPACWEKALKRHSLERALRLTHLHPEDAHTVRQMSAQLKTGCFSDDEREQ